MVESLFRQYAREAMRSSAETTGKERDDLAAVAYMFALADLLEQKNNRCGNHDDGDEPDHRETAAPIENPGVEIGIVGALTSVLHLIAS
jgi:hypothetical protein